MEVKYITVHCKQFILQQNINLHLPGKKLEGGGGVQYIPYNDSFTRFHGSGKNILSREN